jgi:type IV secretory pathway TraG/TraD family ATPase VirD4
VKHPAHKPAVTWWDNGLAFLWKTVFQPLAGVLFFLLNSFGHCLPAPWQGRFLLLLHKVQPSLPNFLALGALFLLLRYTPQKWIAWVPSGFRNLACIFLAFPLGLFLIWAFVAVPASLLYFVTGWINWQLGWATLGLLVVLALGWCLHDRSPKDSKTSHGSAYWQTVETAQKWGRIIPKGRVLSDSYGFVLGRLSKAPPSHDPRLRYMGHVLTCAPTGAGKGIGAVIPNLLDYPGSALVLDIKGENYAVTHRARKKRGNDVFLIDPFAVTGKTGHAFNWLDILNPDDPNVVSDSSMLADMLIVSDRRDNSSHWDDAARDLIQGILIHVAAFVDNERHMGTVRHLLTGGEERLHLVLKEMTETQAGFGLVARAAHGFLIKADRERSGVLSTAIRHTAFLDDPRIVDSMRRSDFDLRNIKRKRMTVFVALPPAKLSAYNRFLRGIVGLTLAAVTHDPVKPTYNVVFFLDEFGQLGRMAAVEDAISLVRGYGVSFWIFVQDLSQLKGVYPKWQTFLANTAKQFFGTADLDTAKYISSMLGNYTSTFHTASQGAQHSSTSEHRHSQALLSPDEVLRMGAHRPIVLIGGEPPYVLERLNYLRDKEYQGLAEENPFHSVLK